MRSGPALLGCALLVTAVVNPGCRSNGRRADVVRVAAIDGVSALTFDGLNVRVEQAANRAPNLYLLVNGRSVEQVNLRVGDGFVITDGRQVHKAYRVLAAEDKQIRLRRQTVVDRTARGEGLHRTGDVIVVEPYDSRKSD